MVLRWTPTVNFNISTGISPTVVALEPSKCDISFITCSYVISAEKSISHSFYTWIILKTSFKVIVVLKKVSVSFFKSNSAVIFIKKEFIKFACSLSWLMRWPFWFSKILFEFKPLLLRCGSIVFQKFTCASVIGNLWSICSGVDVLKPVLLVGFLLEIFRFQNHLEIFIFLWEVCLRFYKSVFFLLFYVGFLF